MTVVATELQPSPEFEEAIRRARADEGATTLLNDFVNGILRRVDKHIYDGLPPLNSDRAGYERISDDTEGLKLGVTRQREDNDSLAVADGAVIPEQAKFQDNDRGASTRSKKSRPAFERLLAYVILGQVKVIYAYSTSRLTRRPLELELLIRLSERYGVRYITKASGSDNLHTADGRMVARIKAAVDAGEAERTAERVQRAAIDAAQRGKPVGGIRPFGYQPDKVTPDPFEAALIRSAATDLINGSATLRSIARDWHNSGVQTVSTEYAAKRAEKAREAGEPVVEDIPAPWHPNVVRNILRNPRIAGWRTYLGKIAEDAEGAPVRGLWVPILDQDTFDRLQVAITTPVSKRQRGKRGARIYMLSGILMCGTCRGRLYGARVDRPGAGPHRYACLGSNDNKHVVGIGGKSIDRFIAKAVVRAYAEEDVEAEPITFDGDARIEEIRFLLKDLSTRYKSGKLKPARYWSMSEELDEELATLLGDRDEFIRLTAGPVVERISLEEFEELSTGEQRARVEAMIEAIIIKPTTSRGPKIDPKRVDIIWKGARRA